MGAAEEVWQRTEVDGIPTYWAESPGPLVGALIFRVGRADEDLRSGGITHLCEHLALFPLSGRVRHPFNGMVDDTRTQFHAEGSPEEVAEFLRATCRNLHDFDRDRIVSERRVLRAEDGSNAHPLWAFRFGPKGYGLAGYREFGLQWLGPDELEAWSSERFTRENAALWFTGEPPAGLELELPSGSRRPPPEPRTVSNLELPSFVRSGGDGAAISLLVERSQEMNLGTGLLTEALQEHLRLELGTSYAAGQSYWRLTPDRAHVIVGVDGAPGSGREVRDGLLRVYDRFLEEGPTEEALARYVATVERYADDPRMIATALESRASDELAGEQTGSDAEYAAERAAMTPSAIARAFQATAGEEIYMISPGLDLPAARATHYAPGRPHPVVEGETLPNSGGADTATFIVGDAGVSQILGREVHTVQFDSTLLALFTGLYELTLLDEWGRSILLTHKGASLRGRIKDLVTRRLDESRIVQGDVELLGRSETALRMLVEEYGPESETWAVLTVARVQFEAEKLVTLLPAHFRGDTGLLVLTDQRLMFANDAGTELPFDVALERVLNPRGSRRLRGGALTVEVDSQEWRFERLSPASRAAELADQLSASA